MNSNAKFSIYKYSDFLILEQNNITYEEFKKDDLNYLMQSIRIVMKDIEKKLVKKQANFETFKVNNKTMGLYFYTSNSPVWKPILIEIIGESPLEKQGGSISEFIKDNVSSSYIVFMVYNRSIYIITGGNGSKYIGEYIDGYFGVDLLPGLINETDSSIKGLQNAKFIGNRQSETYMNKKATKLVDERDMSSLYKNLNVEIPLKYIEEKFGISTLEGENKEKIIKIESKDSLVINRKLTLNELQRVVEGIDKIFYSKKEKFILNYFVPTSKRGIKKQIIEEQLADFLKNGKNTGFTITGENYADYYIGVDKYILEDEKGNIRLEKVDTEITLDDCYDLFEQEKINVTKNFMKKFLNKWRISTEKANNEESLFPLPIKKALQGHVEINTNYGENKLNKSITVFLMDGEWYVINDKYKDTLNKSFKLFYNKNNEEIKKLPFITYLQNKKVDKKQLKNEDKYNLSFKKNLKNNIIVAHKQLLDNLEFADLITWDEENVYLICNKATFDGAGARDLSNQLLVSSQILINKLNSESKEDYLAKYYNKIKKYYDSEKITFLTKDDFINLFSKRIHFVVGYLQNYSPSSRSIYAKYLTIYMNTLITRNLGSNFYVIGNLTVTI